VESWGGAFIIYQGSYLRHVRDAISSIGPGGYKGIAPEYSGELHEVLAELGDAVIFHHAPHGSLGLGNENCTRLGGSLTPTVGS
jgi:hypothetical protein